MFTLDLEIAKNNDYKCQGCNKIFKARDIKLVAIPEDFKSNRKAVKCINRKGRIVLIMFPSNDLGDKLLACPHCNHIHLYGLTTIEKPTNKNQSQRPTYTQYKPNN